MIKICDEFPGYTRFQSHRPFGSSSSKMISVPRSHAKHPTDTYPTASEMSIKRAVETFLPEYAGRQLFNKSMCWCTDTADAALLVCEHPRWKNLILATGDSGCVYNAKSRLSELTGTDTRSSCYRISAAMLSSSWKIDCRQI